MAKLIKLKDFKIPKGEIDKILEENLKMKPDKNLKLKLGKTGLKKL